jgi:hypothetical protein
MEFNRIPSGLPISHILHSSPEHIIGQISQMQHADYSTSNYPALSEIYQVLQRNDIIQHLRWYKIRISILPPPLVYLNSC